MRQSDIIAVFDDLDLSETRHIFESVHTHWLSELISIEQAIGEYYIDMEFEVHARQFTNYYAIQDITIKALTFWKNETERAEVRNSTINRIKIILKNKLLEL